MTTIEIRYCPLGPPTTSHRVTYAWCPECDHARKSNTHCPRVQTTTQATP
jgi:hypothetical protein